jgi:hypothetical protein
LLDGATPRHREAVLDVGANLGSHAQHEPAVGRELQIVGQLGEVERAAGEPHRDIREQRGAGGVLGGEQQREERLVRALRGIQAVEAEPLQLARDVGNVNRVGA